MNEDYGDTLFDAGYRKLDPPDDSEEEHETWKSDEGEFLIDHGGNEWHQMKRSGVVARTGKLDDQSLYGVLHSRTESNDPQTPDQFKSVSTFDSNSNEPRFLRYAKAELARRRDLRCPDCGFMGLPAGDGLCPNCGGKLTEPQQQNLADVREAIIRQVKDSKKR